MPRFLYFPLGSAVYLWTYLQLASNLIKCVLTPCKQIHYAAHNCSGLPKLKNGEAERCLRRQSI